MYYKLMRLGLLYVATFCLILACTHKETNSNHINKDSEWSLTDKLYYDNKAVNWQQSQVDGCSMCLIQTSSVLQPEGITRFNTLYKKGQWIAVQEQSSVNVIRLKLPMHTPYLYVEQLANGELKLFNQQVTLKAAIDRVTNITLNGQLFAIVITQFSMLDEKTAALPRRAKLNYTALKLR